MSKQDNIKDNTLNKLGGTCSILLGVSYLVIAVIYLLVPPEQQEGSGIPIGRFLESLAQNPTPLMLGYLAFAFGSLFGIGAVLAISESVRPINEGWVRWTSTLAIVGFAVNAVDWFRSVALLPASAAAYVQGDAAVKAALTVPGAIAHLDQHAWVRFGAVGLWVLVVNLLALHDGTWPKPLAYVGIALAIGNWIVVASNVVQVPSQLLRTIIVGVSVVILPPIWYIWLGLRLRKAT